MIAGRHVIDASANVSNNASPFVPQHHRFGGMNVTAAIEITPADTGSLDFY